VHKVNTQDDDGWTALQLAARAGAFGTVVLLCESGADIFLKDKHGQTAVDCAKTDAIREYLVNFHKEKDSSLLGACRTGNLETAQASIDGGANVEAVDASGERPLHVAAKHGYIDVVRKLVEKGADINSKGMYGNTALMKAAYWGKYDVVKYLKLWGAEMEAVNDDGLTALHLAAQDGRFECVKYLVEHGAKVETCSNLGWTALTSAASFGHLDVVKYLWFRGADVNFKDGDGLSPAYFAARNGHMNVVRFLATAGADMMSTDKDGKGIADVGKTQLIRAFSKKISMRKDLDLLMDARSGALDAVREKIEDGANVEVEDVNGDRPIHLAAKNGHVDVVKELFKAGADVNALGMYGNTALIKAAYWGKFEVCKHLLQFCGTNIETKNDDGLTALILASQDGKCEVVKFLIEWGANVEATSNIGWTALMVAAAYGHLEVVKMLFFRKAKVETKDTEGWTALHLAARNGYLKIAAFLVGVGADVDTIDNLMRTPEQVAKTPEIAQFFKDERSRQAVGCVHRSSRTADLPGLLQLIAKGMKVDIPDEYTGDTPLHVAAAAGHKDVVHALLTQGNCRVDANGWYDETPMHRAASNGHFEVVKLLKEHGGNVNAQNEDGFTPMTMACLFGRLNLVNFFEESGGDVGTKVDSYVSTSWTPLAAAASRGYLDVVTFLKSKGAVLDVQDDDGWTALHFAARNGHKSVVEFLKGAGANVGIQDKRGMRPFEMAKTKDIALLLWYGVDSEKVMDTSKRGRSVKQPTATSETRGSGKGIYLDRPRTLYEVFEESGEGAAGANVEDIDDGQKGLTRRLFAEYEAVYELLTHVRAAVLESSIAAALGAHNQRLADALQHELDALKSAKRDIGDYPDRHNVERRLTKLYADMDALREKVEVEASKDGLEAATYKDWLAESLAARAELKKHEEECFQAGAAEEVEGAALAKLVAGKALAGMSGKNEAE